MDHPASRATTSSPPRSSLTIPVGFPFPAGKSYTWRVRASTAFHTVEDSTGPGGFYGTAASYQLAQGSDWQFTTASP